MKTLQEYLDYLSLHGYNTNAKDLLCDNVDGIIHSVIVPYNHDYVKGITLCIEYDEYFKYLDFIVGDTEVELDFNQINVIEAYIPCYICNTPDFFTKESDGIYLTDKKNELVYFTFVIEVIKKNPTGYKLNLLNRYSDFCNQIHTLLRPTLNITNFHLVEDSFFNCKERFDSHPTLVYEHEYQNLQLYIWLDVITFKYHLRFIDFEFCGKDFRDFNTREFKKYISEHIPNN